MRTHFHGHERTCHTVQQCCSLCGKWVIVEIQGALETSMLLGPTILVQTERSTTIVWIATSFVLTEIHGAQKTNPIQLLCSS